MINMLSKYKKWDLHYITLYCRRLHGDVVYLSWPIAPLVLWAQIRGGGVVGSQPMRTAVHITWHGAQINFGDLTPYLGTYGILPRYNLVYEPLLNFIQSESAAVLYLFLIGRRTFSPQACGWTCQPWRRDGESTPAPSTRTEYWWPAARRTRASWTHRSAWSSSTSPPCSGRRTWCPASTSTSSPPRWTSSTVRQMPISSSFLIIYLWNPFLYRKPPAHRFSRIWKT